MTLVHDTLVYDSDERFTEILTPYVAEGLAAGEQACVVTRPANAERLRDALGARADQVRFIDATDWYRFPARTIAGYHRTIQSARAAGAPGIRVVGEVEFGDTAAERAAWTRYESVLNEVFATEPARIVCPYDARRLPARVVDDARRTHTHEVVGQGQRRRNEAFVDPHAFVAPLPLALRGALLAEITLDGDLRAVRATVDRVARQVGLSPERTAGLVLALNELATNAIVHGRPPADLRACFDGERLSFEVADAGKAPLDHFAGFRPPDPDAVGGAGLWLARQIADRLEILPGAGPTRVRMSMSVRDAGDAASVPAPPARPTVPSHRSG